MRIWSTKYALSSGITEHEAEASKHSSAMVSYKPNPDKPYTLSLHGEGKDWHRTRESAIKRAESMRIAKIASLKSQLAKLEGMKFE